MTINEINKVVSDIKSLKIQGANAIAMKVLAVLADYTKGIPTKNKRQWINRFEVVAKKLAYTRPNEPLAQNAVNLFRQQARLDRSLLTSDLRTVILDSIVFYQELIITNNKKIIKKGVGLIKTGDNILTHCHSSTVEKIFIASHKKKVKFNVFVDETRPLYQGRITAKNLSTAGISVTQVADSASGFLISPYSGRDLVIDKVIIGADVVRTDGSIVNKIGSYDIAVSAKLNKIPVYIAVNLLKFDVSNNLIIERRSDKEIWPNKPARVKILNFAFDIVTADLITGLITEFGIIKPKEVKKYVNKYYNWIKNGKKI